MIKPDLDDDETSDWEDDEDDYRERIKEEMPGVLLADVDEIDESDTVYSVEADGDEKFSLYRGRFVNGEIEARTLGTFTALVLLRKLRKYGLTMSDEIADELQFPSAGELFWTSVNESLPGKDVFTQRVETGSGSWQSVWSVDLDADGWYNLFVVYEPTDFSYDDLEVTPELHGVFDTREQAIAAIKTGSWGGDEADEDEL